MLITNKSRYAALALFDLAANTGTGHVNLAELSTRYEISVSYLEQIFARLRNEGLVSSARGPGGGYRLARPASAIPMAEILSLFDRDDAEEGGKASKDGDGASHQMWRQFDVRLRTFLSGMTLADLLPSTSGKASGARERNVASAL